MAKKGERIHPETFGDLTRDENRRPVVAVINSSPDVVDMLARALTRAGFQVAHGYTFDIRDGRLDLRAFMERHRPRVVVYDVAPPYDENWRLFERIRRSRLMRGTRFVLTSTNAAHVERLAGNEEHVYEVVGKPYDLNQIVRAAKEAFRSRDTH